VVSSTPQPHFTPGKDPVPILQKAGWAPEPVWMGGKCRPHRDLVPDRPARSQSLYRLNYPAHKSYFTYNVQNKIKLVTFRTVVSAVVIANGNTDFSFVISSSGM